MRATDGRLLCAATSRHAGWENSILVRDDRVNASTAAAFVDKCRDRLGQGAAHYCLATVNSSPGLPVRFQGGAPPRKGVEPPPGVYTLLQQGDRVGYALVEEGGPRRVEHWVLFCGFQFLTGGKSVQPRGRRAPRSQAQVVEVVFRNLVAGGTVAQYLRIERVHTTDERVARAHG